MAATPAGLAQTPSQSAPEAGAKVSARRLGEIAVFPARDAPATVVSQNESRLSAELSAPIVSLAAEVGARLARGAVVAQLDARDFELAQTRAQAALDAAKARQDLADAQLARARDLHARGFFSADALAQRLTEAAVMRADVALAASAVATARRNLDKCTIRAPFPAIVKARHGQVGELAAPGTPLVTLIDVTQLQIAAQVQSRDAASLEQAGDVRFEGQRDSARVRLLRVSAALSREARAQEARLVFKDQPQAPGAEGRIVWRDSAAHIPAHLILRRAGKLGVFTLHGDTAKFVALEGAEEGRAARVGSGGALGQEALIVIDGGAALVDGQKVALGRSAAAIK